MSIEKEIKEKQALLFLTSKSTYYAKLAEIVKALDKNFKKICYVNLDRSYRTIKKNLTKNKIDKKFFVIDVVNKKSKENKEENCKYIDSPVDFGGINIAFSDFVRKGCKSFFFDSLSSMIVQVKESELLKFIHTMIIKAKTANTQIIFLALNENIGFDMFSELTMIFDKIITDKSSKITK